MSPVHTGRCTSSATDRPWPTRGILFAAAGLLLLGSHPLSAQRRDATAPSIQPLRWASAIRTGEPQAWSATLEAMSHASDVPQAAIDAVVGMLHDAAAPVRLRAVLALAAAGPAAASTARPVSSLLEDPDLPIRRASAFALGAINGLRDPEVLRAVFHAAIRDTSPRVRNVLRQSLDEMPGGPVAVGDAFSRELRNALRPGQPQLSRLWGLLVAAHTAVPWAPTEFSRLLGDPDPVVRSTAMYALAGLQPVPPGARVLIERLQSDTTKQVRDRVRYAIRMLKTGPQAPLACSHWSNWGTPSLTPLQVVVDASSEALRGDGQGPYQHGVDGVRTFRSLAFNLFLPWGDDRGLPPIPPDTTHPVHSRSLIFDLSKPVLSSGAKPLGIIRDSAAVLHFHWMWDPGRRVVWTFDNMPVGGRGSGDRTQIDLSIAGHPYKLQIGQWALGDCGEPYAFAAQLNGDGTTPVQIERIGEDEYRLWAPPGSTARLWDYGDPTQPQDLGLYLFSFGIRLVVNP